MPNSKKKNSYKNIGKSAVQLSGKDMTVTIKWQIIDLFVHFTWAKQIINISLHD